MYQTDRAQGVDGLPGASICLQSMGVMVNVYENYSGIRYGNGKCRDETHCFVH